MNKTRFLLAPILSLFDFKIYREAASFSTGKSILYTAYLSSLFMLAFFFFGLSNLSNVNQFVEWLKQNASGITISDTGMKLDVSGKRELNHPQLGPLAIFDDTRTTIQFDEMGSYRLYMTSKMVYMNQNGVVQANEIGSQAKQPFKMRIDHDVIQKIYDRLKVPVAAIILVVVFLLGWVSRLAMAVFLALLGLFVQLFMPRKMSFGHFFNIGSMALSVALFFSAFQLVSWLAPFSPGFLGVLLAVAYFFIGVMVQPKPAVEEDKTV